MFAGDEWLTLPTVAAAIGVDRETIRRRLSRSGRKLKKLRFRRAGPYGNSPILLHESAVSQLKKEYGIGT